MEPNTDTRKTRSSPKSNIWAWITIRLRLKDISWARQRTNISGSGLGPQEEEGTTIYLVWGLTKLLSWSPGPSRATPHCPEPDSRAAPGIGIPRLSHQCHQGLCSQHKLYSCRIWSFPGSLPRQPPDSEPGSGEVNAGLDKRRLRVCLPIPPLVSWPLPEWLLLLLTPPSALLHWEVLLVCPPKSYGLRAIRKKTPITDLVF